MKNCKKMLSLVLVAVMMASLCVPAFAVVNEPYPCYCDDPQPESLLYEVDCDVAWTNETAHVYEIISVYQCCICNGEVEIIEYKAERHFCSHDLDGGYIHSCTCDVCGRGLE